MNIKNNLFVSFRQLKSDKTNTFISISGLIMGLGIVAVLVVFVLNELSYNSSFSNKDRIYRVVNFSKNDNYTWATTPFVVGETANNNFAEVENFVHQYNIENIEIEKNTNFIAEHDLMCVESNFFSIFGVKILQGSLTNFDETKNKIALSKKIAGKYFGTENPIGQQLNIRCNGKESLMEVAAVYDNIPNNSTIKALLITNMDFGLRHLSANLISNNDRPSVDQIRQSWNMSLIINYILLKKGTDINSFEAKLRQTGIDNQKENMPLLLSLQPLSDIYFGSGQIKNSGTEKGNRSMLILLCIIGLLILLVATINYLNLASARVMSQVKNLAVCKVCGADQKNIVGQIIAESMLVTLIALPFAVLAACVAMPVISQMFGKSYTVEITGQMVTSLVLLVIITFATGILSGMLVSIRVSRFSLVNTLKGNKQSGGEKDYVRKAMVVFQLSVFIVLIAVTFLVQKQVRYAFNKDLGYAKDGLISVSIGDHNFDLFKQEIEKNPNVIDVTSTLWMPPTNNNIYLSLPKIDNPKEKVKVNALFVNYDFAKTLGLKLIMGSDFDKEKINKGVLVNESAVKVLGLTDIIGEQTVWGKIVGVVNDFNMLSLHETISPMLIVLNPAMCKIGAIRLRTDNFPGTIKFLEDVWKSTGGTTAFHFEFTDDIMRQMYESDIRFSKTIGFLAVIAIAIASLGLLGLSLLIGKQRTKEIGIRKVNGAKISEVMTMLNRDFVKWVTIAFFIAVPIAWYAMHLWLENFAYKTNLSWWIFALAGVLTLGIALLTVSWQSWKSATRNPVEALRYE